MFDVRESTCLPSVSRAMAKYPRSLTQKSRLKRRLGSAASFSSWPANSGSRQKRRASRAPRTLASYA